MISRLALPLVSAAVLAGCVSAPRVETQLSAAVPANVTAYRLLEAEAPSEADRAAAEAVRQALSARGWREVDDKAAWRIETAYAVRPQKTGVFTDVDARQGEWTDAPRLPQWWSQGRQTHSLTVILTGPGNEAGAYRASAVAILDGVRPKPRRACWPRRPQRSWTRRTRADRPQLHSSSVILGRVRMKVAPGDPGWWRMVPPWRSATVRTKARPRPAPR